MKRFFYAKTALTNLKKNRQTCFPYLLTCIATIMMFYIMSSLSTNSALNKMRGGATMGIVLMFGTVVVGIFAVLFLFYTNSFLVKRRKKEFGLYYILGMEKRHISRVMLWETLYTAMLSLLLGIACGILFSKLVFLGLLKILKMNVVIGVEISAFTLAETVGLFAVIFLPITVPAVKIQMPAAAVSAVLKKITFPFIFFCFSSFNCSNPASSIRSSSTKRKLSNKSFSVISKCPHFPDIFLTAHVFYAASPLHCSHLSASAAPDLLCSHHTNSVS